MQSNNYNFNCEYSIREKEEKKKSIDEKYCKENVKREQHRASLCINPKGGF